MRAMRAAKAAGLIVMCGLWLLGVAMGSTGKGQTATTVYQGSWTASAGGERYLRGTWSGQLSGASRNSAQGSWTLISDAGEVLMEGSWSARKAGQAWEGTWTARVARDGSFSGTWSADLKASDGKTLEEMLMRTIEKQVAGAWQSGRMAGYWWLQGMSGKKRR